MFPIVVAIVILRYRLFDIEIIINRSLVYATLLALLAAMYLIVVQALSWFVQIVLRRPNDLLVTFLATLSVAFAFAPLRARVRIWIDRIFYRAKVDYQALLPEMSDRLATSIVLEQVAALLTEELPRRLQIAWAELSTLDPEGTCIAPVDDGPLPELSLAHPVAEHLRRWAHPLLRLDLPPDVPAATTELLAQSGTELLIPLMVGADLVGLYREVLHEKLDGPRFLRRFGRFCLEIPKMNKAVRISRRKLRKVEASLGKWWL